MKTELPKLVAVHHHLGCGGRLDYDATAEPVHETWRSGDVVIETDWQPLICLKCGEKRPEIAEPA